MDNEKIFSETEDTPLKQFLSGNRIYTMLAAAIICAIVFIPTLANIIGIYKNVKKSENVMDISEVNLASDLDGQYITGSAYKFLARLGYIAESGRQLRISTISCSLTPRTENRSRHL